MHVVFKLVADPVATHLRFEVDVWKTKKTKTVYKIEENGKMVATIFAYSTTALPISLPSSKSLLEAIGEYFAGLTNDSGIDWAWA